MGTCCATAVFGKGKDTERDILIFLSTLPINKSSRNRASSYTFLAASNWVWLCGIVPWTIRHSNIIWSSAFAVGISNRVVIAIREHVATEDALTGGCEGVRVDEAMDDWVVITALEVIPSRFCLILVPAKAKWSDFCGNNFSIRAQLVRVYACPKA